MPKYSSAYRVSATLFDASVITEMNAIRQYMTKANNMNMTAASSPFGKYNTLETWTVIPRSPVSNPINSMSRSWSSFFRGEGAEDDFDKYLFLTDYALSI
jgi:hypothetical protein